MRAALQNTAQHFMGDFSARNAELGHALNGLWAVVDGLELEADEGGDA